jgi:hypothetical protein
MTFKGIYLTIRVMKLNKVKAFIRFSVFIFFCLLILASNSSYTYARSSYDCGNCTGPVDAPVCAGDVPPNRAPAKNGGVVVHNVVGGSQTGMRTATIPVGARAVLDTTPKDASGQHTQVADLAWHFSGNTGVVSVTREDCFLPMLTGVASGVVTVTVTYTSIDGSTYTTPQSRAAIVTVGTAGPSTTPNPDEDPDLEDPDVWACQNDEGKYVCVPGVSSAEDCAQNTLCEGKRCDKIDPAQCAGGGVALPAQPTVPSPPLAQNELGALIGQIFNWSIQILGIAVFSMILFAGFEWITAAGNRAKIASAKKRIYNALLGAMLLLSSYIILKVINPDFVGQSFDLPAIEQQSP